MVMALMDYDNSGRNGMAMVLLMKAAVVMES